MTKDGRLLNQTEAAKVCGVRQETIAEWIRREVDPLPAFRNTPRGRLFIDADVLDQWLKARSEEPKPATERQLLALPVLSSALRRVTTVRNPRATVRDPLRGGFAT